MDIKKSFEILNLSPGVSLKEVKQAYRNLARVRHPDRFHGEPRLKQKAEEKFKEINEAYRMVVSFLKTNLVPLNYESSRHAKYREANNGKSQTTASEEPATELYPDDKTGSSTNGKGGGNRKKKTDKGIQFESLAYAAERAHAGLVQTKSPYRFCVYQNHGETFIDIVILDKNGKIKEIKKSNIAHREFLTLMRHIENGEGLLVDIEM